MDLVNIFEPSIADLKTLLERDAVKLFHHLLLAEARMIGVRPLDINVPSAITVADGGIDAAVEAGSIDETLTKGLIFPGINRYQIKTGPFPISERTIHELILKPSAITREGKGAKRPKSKTKKEKKVKIFTEGDINDRVRYCFNEHGTYFVVLFGCDNPGKTEHPIETGIQNLLDSISPKYANAKIKILMPNQLTTLIANYFPGTALTLKGISGSGQIHGIEYLQKCCNLDGQSHYLKTEDHEKVIEQIKSAFTTGQQLTHIRIVGEPGIGKTHLVYEAIMQSKLNSIAMYIEKPDSLFETETINQLYYLAKQTPFILIADECNATTRTKLQKRFGSVNIPITIISIHNELEDQDSTHPYNFISPPPLTTLEVSQILQLNYSIRSDDADRIAVLCSGSPRVAHIVGRHLALHPDAVSLIQLNGLENIWNIYIAGRADINSEEYRLQHLILSFIALFRQFGWETLVKEEGKYIYDLIHQSADQTLTWDKFSRVIKQLRNRRILQGNSTLYISPKLLHIKLWCDWWENYSSLYEINALISGLKGELRRYFNEMFIYAKESKAAEDIVRNLLGPTGPFNTIDGYMGNGGHLFLMLARTNPRAAVQAVEIALENKTCQELIRFTNGRREIINALEYIALYGNNFEAATKCLSQLAEAENERWSNNATGVFKSLFVLGYGRAASTDLSPLERLPILKNYLISPNKKIQELALQAFDQALATHITRSDIRGYIGIKIPTPEGWTPKTMEEIYESYRIYLTTLWDSSQEFLNEDNQRKAGKIILSHARELINRSIAEDEILKILELLSATDSEQQFDVIQTIVTILHYDNDKLGAEAAKKLQELNKKLTENSFPSQLRRYVGLDLIEDRYTNKGKPKDPEEKVRLLAQEVQKHPNILNQELDWLVTKTARNGFAFGKQLGLLDLDANSWKKILDTWLKTPNQNELFIGGYLAGIFQNNIPKWESLINQIANGEGASQLPYVVMLSGMTADIALLLLNHAEKKSFNPNIFRNFIYGAVIKTIPADTLLLMLKLLINLGEQENLFAALDIIYSATYKEQMISNELLDICEKITSHPAFFTESSQRILDTMVNFHWNEVALILAKNNINKAIPIATKCIENLGCSGTIVDGHQPESLGFLNLVTKEKPIEIWDTIVKFIDPPLKMRGIHIMQWLGGGFDKSNQDTLIFLHIPKDNILHWVSEKPDTRAPAIAHFLSIEISQLADSSLARELLVRYGNSKEVQNSLHASFHTEAWSGSNSIHYKEKLKLIQGIRDKEKNQNILRWLDDEIEALTRQIKIALIEEERGKF